MKQLVDNLEIIGKSQDSGYAHPLYLIKTKDKKFVQLTELLYNTVVALKEEQEIHAVAKKLTELQQQEVDEKAVKFLIEKKLEPLGLVTDSQVIFEAQTQKNSLQTPDILLGLRYRMTLVPEN